MSRRKTNIQKRKYAVTMQKAKSNKSRRRPWGTIAIVSVSLVFGGVLYFAPSFKNNANATEIFVYKSRTCGCCNKWVSLMRKAGFIVKTINRINMTSVKSSAGVWPDLQSCHTAFVDDFVVEGHVPATDIRRMLQDRPQVTGIAVPGMVLGSPGMEGNRKVPYKVLAFDPDGRTTVYATY